MKRIVHCRLGGGLGNQLFRYAAARALALELDADSVFEVGGFSRDSFGRKYLLDHFVGPRSLRKTRMRDSFPGRLLLRLGRRNRKCLWEREFMEKPPGASDVGMCRKIAIEGYWQSEIYFRKHRETILKELEFGIELDAANRTWVDHIQAAEDAVAIHFRSYREVACPVAGKIMPAEYYSSACRKILERYPRAKFFLFTDDVQAARAVLSHELELKFVDVNSEGGEEAGVRDLYLMSRCRHFITANSSFSWWGAWLSQNVHGMFEETPAGRVACYPSERLSHPAMVPSFGKTLDSR